jgi:CheY-like chemotaxis protein
MPRLNGIDCAQKIRDFESGAQLRPIPIVFQTSTTSSATRQR